MEDHAKATAKALDRAASKRPAPDAASGKEARATFVAYMDDPSRAPEPAREEGLTTSAKALDRWFRERQKQPGQPRLLEIPNEVLVTSAGPLNLTGNITLVDEDGAVRYYNHLNLCRCGASKDKPICDGQHLEREFLHAGRIHEVSDTPHSERPCKITISAIKNGPLTFRGKLRLHNTMGQECVKQRGALCRCGQSANKPFCDGSHEKVGFRSGR